MKLKYLWIAEFLDGSFLLQSQEDVSRIYSGLDADGIFEVNAKLFGEPSEEEKERFRSPVKSQFFDVLNSSSPLIRFTLTDGEIEYGVDLRTLNFNVNGNEFRLHDQTELPLKEQQLVFYRRRNEENTATMQVQSDMSLKEIGQRKITSSIAFYVIGWTAKNRAGKEVQRYLQFE